MVPNPFALGSLTEIRASYNKSQALNNTTDYNYNKQSNTDLIMHSVHYKHHKSEQNSTHDLQILSKQPKTDFSIN
jgi:hypothetical protein